MANATKFKITELHHFVVRAAQGHMLIMRKMFTAPILSRLAFIAFLAVVTQSQAEPAAYSLMYNRADWKHWIDSDGDCQNTRAETLIAKSRTKIEYTGYKKCAVKSGLWEDFYSGEQIRDANDLDIDHVVALKYAHGHGGDKWAAAKKMAFANDPANLVVTVKKINRSKNDKGPDEWQPPNPRLACRYLRQFKEVVIHYRLMLIPAEKQSLAVQLAKCTDANRLK